MIPADSSYCSWCGRPVQNKTKHNSFNDIDNAKIEGMMEILNYYKKELLDKYYLLPDAVENGRLDIVKALIGSCVKIDEKDNKGNTGLIIAARDGYEDIVLVLINNDAKINIRNASGETALFWAEKNKHKKIVSLLKSKGAKR